MPNHVHLIVVPQREQGLRRAIGEAHRGYTRRVNFRAGWRGHLWQGRFASFVMDEAYLLAAARYVELNPVLAGLVVASSDYRWSSVWAHLAVRDDGLVRVGPLLELAGDWRRLLSSVVGEEDLQRLRERDRTGRPVGDDAILERLERQLGRVLRRQKPGRKRKRKAEDLKYVRCPRELLEFEIDMVSSELPRVPGIAPWTYRDRAAELDEAAQTSGENAAAAG